MIEARRAVKTLKEYHPPLGQRAGLRLDFNENVGGCSPRVLEKLRTLSTEVLNKYPERFPGEVVMAEFLKLRQEQVLLTNGVDEGIHVLAETYLEEDDEAIIVVPTFSLYEIYAAATAAKVVAVQAKSDFSFPMEDLLKAINPKTRLIFIANPNNPTGAVVPRNVLLDVLKAAPNAALLLDEAYFDFYGECMMDVIGQYDNLFISRTFSKAYGLAGFRMGVICGATEQMRMVKRVASPYNVNGIALECLQAALEDQEFVLNYVTQVKRGRARLMDFYHEQKIAFWPSEANFVLAYFGKYNKQLVEEMRRRRILVRDRNSDPGCAGCVRITIGTDEHTDRLMRELPLALKAIGYQTQVREESLAEAKR